LSLAVPLVNVLLLNRDIRARSRRPGHLSIQCARSPPPPTQARS